MKTYILATIFFFGELDPDPAAAAVAIVGTMLPEKGLRRSTW
jgi:hypothetical protein